MDYIIRENKLSHIIQNYLDKNYGGLRDEIADPDPWDKEDGVDYSKIIEFVNPNEIYGDVEFLYLEDGWNTEEKCDKCPEIHFAGLMVIDLSELFGNFWIEPFKIWFKEKFNKEINYVEI